MKGISFVKTVAFLTMVEGMILIMIGGFLLGTNVAEAVMEYSGSAQRIYIGITFMFVTLIEFMGICLFVYGDCVLSCLKKES